MKKEAIKKEIKLAYKDLWRIYQRELKEAGYKKLKLENVLNAELNEWEDIGFFIGYIRGLEMSLKD